MACDDSWETAFLVARCTETSTLHLTTSGQTFRIIVRTPDSFAVERLAGFK